MYCGKLNQFSNFTHDTVIVFPEISGKYLENVFKSKSCYFVIFFLFWHFTQENMFLNLSDQPCHSRASTYVIKNLNCLL